MEEKESNAQLDHLNFTDGWKCVFGGVCVMMVFLKE